MRALPRGAEAAALTVSDRLLAAVALFGSDAARRARLEEYRRAGVTQPVVAPVGEDLPDDVAARDSRDPAATVRRRTRLVQPFHGGTQIGVPGCRAAVEHLAGRQLTVEDVPADEAVLVLHRVRADHLPAHDRVGEPGRQRLHARGQPVRVPVQFVAVRLPRPRVRYPLAEHGHDVVPGARGLADALLGGLLVRAHARLLDRITLERLRGCRCGGTPVV